MANSLKGRHCAYRHNHGQGKICTNALKNSVSLAISADFNVADSFLFQYSSGAATRGLNLAAEFRKFNKEEPE
ncbi:MAG: hypothetical protein A2283_13020 [Lentisphaerae bacterium RIFOXYA12_FULL_48_11]|nr:MAG: hypothetical protein A2283_13020 [Lentisphaerae bacterium RIFOXYA12_FULL_48_11]